MWRFLSSLTFLYALAGILLVLFAIWQYNDFRRGKYKRSRFLFVFGITAIACLGFLGVHFHAPLSLKTFSNLDHYFIKHDGFRVKRELVLGQTDSANYRKASYNEFIVSAAGEKVRLHSPYSEEPSFYTTGEKYSLLSPHYTANGHSLSLRVRNQQLGLSVSDGDRIELQIEDRKLEVKLLVKKGIQVWSLFRDHPDWINNPSPNDEAYEKVLNEIYLVRDELNRSEYGELIFFISGKLFSLASSLQYDGQAIAPQSLRFEKELDPGGSFAWGISFLDNNRNQFRFRYDGQNLLVLPRYPLSFPLIEEDRSQWTGHNVTKFLAGHQQHMNQLPVALREGFLFTSPAANEGSAFAPLLLQYKKAAADVPIQFTANYLHEGNKSIPFENNQLILPARNNQFEWMFSVENSFHWKFGGWVLSPAIWQLLIFGSLLFFVLMVVANCFVGNVSIQSFVANVLSIVVLVLLTTRYFLYWRYKSFPPYEGLDLPSVQQLESAWNFGIILGATILLGLLFGWGVFKAIGSGRTYKRKLSLFDFSSAASNLMHGLPIIHKWKPVAVFLLGWFVLLAIMGGYAAATGFDSSTCRHVAIALVVLYFLFLHTSYRFSPLMTDQARAWWRVSTSRRFEMLVNNPIKILLSLSLLATFVFIDIGFAIVFLNFLLFHEAFLCINYGIAGLHTGSRFNAAWMAGLGVIYLLLFVLNLLFAPFVFQFLLSLSEIWYLAGYIVFAILIAYVINRLLFERNKKFKRIVLAAVVLFFPGACWLFLPKQKILDKASMTRYRIDVLTRPAGDAIAKAYEDGKNHIPVIRAAQNQWFINTFIDRDNNPHVNRAGFNLLPHAPQNKGARYNAQATDLVSSRFIVAEHGQAAILLYVCLLLLPAVLLTSFYKLYPDFTSRVNTHYASVSTGFGVLNYLVITAMMVVLAATGRYIFFGQDLPFGSILSKQSILFPLLLVAVVVILFKSIPAERYMHPRKWLPGAAVFGLLILLLFFVRPAFNRQKEFGIEGLASGMEEYVSQYIQPIFDHIDTARKTRNLPIQEKDRLFSDSLRGWLDQNPDVAANPFFKKEAQLYASSGFARHRDERKLLYLDLRGNSPKMAVNAQYFRVDPPPHLQSLWKGDVVGDTSIINLAVLDGAMGNVFSQKLIPGFSEDAGRVVDGLELKWNSTSESFSVIVANRLQSALKWRSGREEGILAPGQEMRLRNQEVVEFLRDGKSWWVSLQPDSYMRNYYVNGSRYYHYPLAEDFIWARNFAEAVSVDFASRGEWEKTATISLDYELTDSLTTMIRDMLNSSTEYPAGAAYGVTVVDSRGRVLAMADHIKGLQRVDPNNKAAFQKLLLDEEGQMRSSDWRNHLGNLNLLRLNPGPGSTLKPIVFAAIASQMDLDWPAFSSSGFSEKQTVFGGMRVPEYDWELNNGTVSSVSEYLRLSDNYYHANLLLLGSYRKQPIARLLREKFGKRPVGEGIHWPYFRYRGETRYMSGFSNWPGYEQGRADFGSDSSFLSIGLTRNFSIGVDPRMRSGNMFDDVNDNSLIGQASRQSGFVLPEWSLWDQKGIGIDHRIPYDLFLHCFRGHVKGSSQVMISPLGMAHAMGRLVSQNRNYNLSLDSSAPDPEFKPFDVDPSIPYNQFLDLMRTQVFKGMKDVMERGTGAALGRQLRQGAPYYYFGKTGTTGDDEKKTKSKLFALVISKKDISAPGHVFRDNPFVIVYFTSQNGPARQNEEFQAKVVKWLEGTAAFKSVMSGNRQL